MAAPPAPERNCSSQRGEAWEQATQREGRLSRETVDFSVAKSVDSAQPVFLKWGSREHWGSRVLRFIKNCWVVHTIVIRGVPR